MSDPDGMERYCSSYYDKHGLYNDGFPCPINKYCCQTPDGGSKMCCSMQKSSVAGVATETENNSNDYSRDNEISSKKENLAFKYNTKSPMNQIRTTLSNLNNFLLEQKQQSHLNFNNINNNNNNKNSHQFNGIFNSNKQSFIAKSNGDVGIGAGFVDNSKLNFNTDSSITSYSSFTLPFFITK